MVYNEHMNTKLASEVVRHIEQYPQNHCELHWGEQTELGTVASVAGFTALFGGRAKIKNQAIELAEVDNVAPDWVKVGQELLEIPFNTAFRMFILSDEYTALEALRSISLGKLPNWRYIWNKRNESKS